MIKWIRTSRLSIKNYLSLHKQEEQVRVREALAFIEQDHLRTPRSPFFAAEALE